MGEIKRKLRRKGKPKKRSKLRGFILVGWRMLIEEKFKRAFLSDRQNSNGVRKRGKIKIIWQNSIVEWKFNKQNPKLHWNSHASSINEEYLQTCNPGRNICRLFHMLPQFLTTSETEIDYYHQKMNVQVALGLAERPRTYALMTLRNFKKTLKCLELMGSN